MCVCVGLSALFFQIVVDFFVVAPWPIDNQIAVNDFRSEDGAAVEVEFGQTLEGGNAQTYGEGSFARGQSADAIFPAVGGANLIDGEAKVLGMHIDHAVFVEIDVDAFVVGGSNPTQRVEQILGGCRLQAVCFELWKVGLLDAVECFGKAGVSADEQELGQVFGLAGLQERAFEQTTIVFDFSRSESRRLRRKKGADLHGTHDEIVRPLPHDDHSLSVHESEWFWEGFLSTQ